jgi:hypothetical protein
MFVFDYLDIRKGILLLGNKKEYIEYYKEERSYYRTMTKGNYLSLYYV